jgi:ATP-binding cassette subfamily B protein
VTARRVRVHELVRWAGLDSRAVIGRLARLGVRVSNHAATVSALDAARLLETVRAEQRGEGERRVRVHELARRAGLSNRETLERLRAMGISVRSHAATVPGVDADRLLTALAEAGGDGRSEGTPVYEIAQETGLTHEAVLQRLPRRRHDGSALGAWSSLSPEEAQRVRATAGSRPAHRRAPGDGHRSAAALHRPSATNGHRRPAPAGNGHHATPPDVQSRPPPDGSSRSFARRTLAFLRPFRLSILAVFGIDLLATPLALLSPVPLKIAVDSVIGDDPLPGFLAPLVPSALIGSQTALLVCAAVFQVVVILLVQGQSMSSHVLHTSTGERLTLAVRERLFGHAQRLSLSYHDSRGTGDSLYRVQYDAPSLQHLLDGVSPFLAAAVTLISALVVTAIIDWQVAVVAMVVTPLLTVVSRVYIRRIKPRYHGLKEVETTALKVIQEVLGQVRVVKAFGTEDREQQRFRRHSGESVRTKIRLAFLEGLYGLNVNLITGVGTALVLFVGVRNVLGGALTLGELLLVMGYLQQLYGPLQDVSQTVGSLQSSVAGAERAFALLDQEPEVREHPTAQRMERAKGAIELRDVTFSYNGRNPVLSEVSFAVEPGERVGVKGPTGAGKTTLASLLMRFYDPDRGRILLDGVDLRDLRVADVRRQLALVLQEPVLFSASVAENIGYARPGARRPEIERAAEAAEADAFIRGLPDGYETLVGERGMRLSGGQRQRISLARAFLKDAPVLVLDEPTSAVDQETEAAIMATMERLMAGRTSLLITHRLATLEKCDRLLEVDGGRVREAAAAGEEAPA